MAAGIVCAGRRSLLAQHTVCRRQLCIQSVNAPYVPSLQVCEGTDAVPPNARSHTSLVSGVFIGDVQVLVRLKFGIEASREVAMSVVVRSADAAVNETVHQIIQDA